jgi:hypothetical protein
MDRKSKIEALLASADLIARDGDRLDMTPEMASVVCMALIDKVKRLAQPELAYAAYLNARTASISRRATCLALDAQDARRHMELPEDPALAPERLA